MPQLTVGPAFVRAVKGALLKDVHLMVGDPVEKIGDYVRAGADILTVHYEAGPHVHRVLQSMGGCANANDPARGLVRGLALNPGTPVGVTEPLLDEIDLLLLLAVNPGWGGQSFIESTRRQDRPGARDDPGERAPDPARGRWRRDTSETSRGSPPPAST